MKYLFINSVYGFGSTGRIIADKCEQLKNEGHECAAAYARTSQDICPPQIIKKKNGQNHRGIASLNGIEGKAADAGKSKKDFHG